MSVCKAGRESLTWQDVLHQKKVIDQRVPPPTVLHAAAVRDTDTGIVANTQHLPIRSPRTPLREVVVLVGVVVAEPAV